MTPTLVELLRMRDPEAMDRMLAEHGRVIQGVAYHILHDRSDAEDVLAETVIAAWQNAGQLRQADSIRPWLLRICVNRSLSRRRSGARFVHLAALPEGVTDDTAQGSTEPVAMLGAIAGLPPRIRAAIALRYYADLSVEEVARALGTSPNTVKAQLQSGLDRLRVEVVRDDD